MVEVVSGAEERHTRRIVTRLAVLATIGAALLFSLYIAADWQQDYWPRLVREHFAAIVGLPAAAAGAFIVVALFRQSEGPIEIEALGFKMKGATGPVILWALCFFVMAWAIKETWSLGGI